MKYVLIWLSVAIAAVSGAETAQKKIDALDAVPGMLQAGYLREPVSIPFFGSLYTAIIGWYYDDDGVAKNGSAPLIIVALGTEDEAAYWLDRVPDILTQNVAETYITDRDGGGFTLAEVESFANAAWRHVAVGNQVGALDIKQFSVENIDGKSIQVSGLFNLVAGGGTWVRRSYILTAIDPNGAFVPGNDNVEFQRVVESSE